MRWSTLPTVVALLAVAGHEAADVESDILELDITNFAAVVDPEPLILVEFFAPW